MFNDRFIRSIVERMDDNADIGKILDDEVFKTVVMDHYLQRVYTQAQEPGPPGR